MHAQNHIEIETRWGRTRAGMWELRWSERDAATGRVRTRAYSCGTDNFEAAQVVRQGWLTAQVQAAGPGALVLLADVLDAYERARGSRSQKWALLPVRRHFVGYAVADLTEAAGARYVAARLAAVSSGTVRREVGALSAALNWAADRRRKLIPADAVPAFDLPAEGAPRTGYLSAAEAERMFGLARDRALSALCFRERRVGYFLCLALETAAREAAIRGLTRDRVDLNVGVIDFRDPTLAVSRKRRVPVPISARLRPVIEDMLARPGDPGGRFVLGHSGAIRKSFKRFCAAHGFPGVTIHDLRRTWASLRAQWGVDMAQIAGVLGDTVETTEKHYAHLSPGYLREAVDAAGPRTRTRTP